MKNDFNLPICTELQFLQKVLFITLPLTLSVLSHHAEHLKYSLYLTTLGLFLWPYVSTL